MLMAPLKVDSFVFPPIDREWDRPYYRIAHKIIELAGEVHMPNPEEFAVAAKLGAEVLDEAAPQLVAKLPGLVELAGGGTRVVSMLEPETRALIETAASHSGDPIAGIVLRAGESAGIPLGVDTARIAAVRESLIGGSSTEIGGAVSNAFRPRTYSEMMAFYGG